MGRRKRRLFVRDVGKGPTRPCRRLSAFLLPTRQPGLESEFGFLERFKYRSFFSNLERINFNTLCLFRMTSPTAKRSFASGEGLAEKRVSTGLPDIRRKGSQRKVPFPVYGYPAARPKRLSLKRRLTRVPRRQRRTLKKVPRLENGGAVEKRAAGIVGAVGWIARRTRPAVPMAHPCRYAAPGSFENWDGG